MPYITKEDRELLDPLVDWDITGAPAGHVNYLLTRIIVRWLGKVEYEKLALATGVLENVKQELYRRVAARYEDSKCVQNGDVY